MSKIAINELRPAGTMFFSEPETFLNNLTDENTLTKLSGGLIGDLDTVLERITQKFTLPTSALCDPNQAL